ncbi:DUF539 domain-containing protein [Candidatus Marinimicrobia bacterium]|nr:DUF539 domain-containing protein [Candidatus Neomarinimicrobiota bacterium]
MNLFLITLFVIFIAIFAMSLGTIFSNISLKGSCGGDEEVCICSPEERKKCFSKITAP